MIKILAIGNSFSEDATAYLDALSDAGDAGLVVGNLYIGGCPLRLHWENAVSDAPAYRYTKTGQETTESSIRAALEGDDWDYVTLQQVSHQSGMFDTFMPYLPFLSGYVRGIKPRSVQLIHQTWAYQKDSDHGGFANYNRNQDRMFSSLKDAYFGAAIMLDTKILPSGEAWQRTRATEIGDTLCRDGFHGGPKGRYIAAGVWYEALTGKRLADNPFIPEGVDKREAAIIADCVREAVAEYGWNR